MKQKKFEYIIIKFWWVFLFIIISFLGFDRLTKKKNKEIYNYKKNFLALEKEKNQEKEKRDFLNLRINSQNDPEWIELILMKKLGVVPKGKIKVRFVEKNQ